MRKKTMAIVSLLLGILLLPIQALAYTSINEEQDVTLTIKYELPEISFRLFQVADISKTVKYTLTEQFEDYPVVLDDLDSEGWRDAAQTFAGYVERDNLAPLITGKTAANGEVVFEELENGIYLVVGESYTTDERLQYVVMPFLLSLPTLTELDEWDYEPVVLPKYDVEELPEEISLEVIKLWKSDSSKDRPETIVVQLLKNQETYEEVALDAANGWKYEWEDLDPEANWSVVEKQVPDNYTVKVSKANHVFTITNTGSQITSGATVLPQTGQLWWPVPVLAVTGVLLLIVGLWSRKRR